MYVTTITLTAASVLAASVLFLGLTALPASWPPIGMAEFTPETLDTVRWIVGGLATAVAAVFTVIYSGIKWFASLLFSQDCDKDGLPKGLVTRLHREALDKLDDLHVAITPSPNIDRINEIGISLGEVSTSLFEIDTKVSKLHTLLEHTNEMLKGICPACRSSDDNPSGSTGPGKPR